MACIGGVWVHLEPAFRPVGGKTTYTYKAVENTSSHDILVLVFWGTVWILVLLSFALDEFSRRISMDV